MYEGEPCGLHLSSENFKKPFFVDKETKFIRFEDLIGQERIPFRRNDQTSMSPQTPLRVMNSPSGNSQVTLASFTPSASRKPPLAPSKATPNAPNQNRSPLEHMGVRLACGDRSTNDDLEPALKASKVDALTRISSIELSSFGKETIDAFNLEGPLHLGKRTHHRRRKSDGCAVSKSAEFRFWADMIPNAQVRHQHRHGRSASLIVANHGSSTEDKNGAFLLNEKQAASKFIQDRSQDRLAKLPSRGKFETDHAIFEKAVSSFWVEKEKFISGFQKFTDISMALEQQCEPALAFVDKLEGGSDHSSPEDPAEWKIPTENENSTQSQKPVKLNFPSRIEFRPQEAKPLFLESGTLLEPLTEVEHEGPDEAQRGYQRPEYQPLADVESDLMIVTTPNVERSKERFVDYIDSGRSSSSRKRSVDSVISDVDGEKLAGSLFSDDKLPFPCFAGFSSPDIYESAGHQASYNDGFQF